MNFLNRRSNTNLKDIGSPSQAKRSSMISMRRSQSLVSKDDPVGTPKSGKRSSMISMRRSQTMASSKVDHQVGSTPSSQVGTPNMKWGATGGRRNVKRSSMVSMRRSQTVANKDDRPSSSSSSKPRRTRSMAIKDSDIDDIYELVKQMKQTKVGESMLQDFVEKQAGQVLRGADRSSSSKSPDRSMKFPPKEIIMCTPKATAA